MSLAALPLVRSTANAVPSNAVPYVPPTHDVTLPEAHRGTLEIDTRLLDSYGPPPAPLRQFYLDARKAFADNRKADFTDDAIVQAAGKHQLQLMGGPMLGHLRADGVTFWLRPANTAPVTIAVGNSTQTVRPQQAGEAVQINVKGLKPDSHYSYRVIVDNRIVADGGFRTAPAEDSKGTFRLTFGSCCHKIGIHNVNLYQQILQRSPHAMMLLGDIAVDDRNDEINMHRADYQLRDVSTGFRSLATQVPLYASWDDHDYFDNDLSGIPRRYTASDRDNVRRVYQENWINPPRPAGQEGIYFNARIGPVEIIMLDTRSCRDGSRRNKYGSYLGEQQTQWLHHTLKASTAPFKVISSGTMWSDYVSKAKDSWGSWDKEAREELFTLIEQEQIGGVLLVSGDRHGARGFRIPRPSGFSFYEFEPATLGGVSGPAGIVKNCPEQLFGYNGKDPDGQNLVAFGEFTFNTEAADPSVTFRLITQFGEVREEIDLALSTLTPPHDKTRETPLLNLRSKSR